MAQTNGTCLKMYALSHMSIFLPGNIRLSQQTEVDQYWSRSEILTNLLQTHPGDTWARMTFFQAGLSYASSRLSVWRILTLHQLSYTFYCIYNSNKNISRSMDRSRPNICPCFSTLIANRSAEQMRLFDLADQCERKLTVELLLDKP